MNNDPNFQNYPPNPNMPNYPPNYQNPMMPPAKKKKRPFLIGCLVLVGVLVLCGIIGAIASAGKGSDQTPTTSQVTTSTSQTPPPTSKPKTKTWQTTHTYSGNGSKKTETFTVGENWKIQWSCQGDVSYGIDALLYITVYQHGKSFPIDSPSTTCKATTDKTIGETEEHQSGTFYLGINAGIEWTITIKELK